MTEPTGWARGEVIGAIGVVVGVLAIWAGLAIYFAAALRDPDDREHLKAKYEARLDSGRWFRMRAALVGLLGQIDNWFGYVAIDGSRSAFALPWARCASVAFAYPVLFFLVGYVFARQGNVGGVGWGGVG